jgi:hypothetical protein
MIHPILAYKMLLKDRIMKQLVDDKPSGDSPELKAILAHIRMNLTREVKASGLLNPLSSYVLFNCVKILKPEVIIETGVANGVSSSILLSALESNNKGYLHSIDLKDEGFLPKGKDIGWLIPEYLKARWHLYQGDSKHLLPRLVKHVGFVDIFLHDSDHDRENILLELGTIWPFLSPKGIILVDDWWSNSALNEFAGSHNLKVIKAIRIAGVRKN